MKTESKIYCLFDYEWWCVTLVSSTKTSHKVSYRLYDGRKVEKRIKVDKCAYPGERICVVWEQWKGKNGRGGYRVEKNLYDDFRVPAESVPMQGFCFSAVGYVTEPAKYGTIEVWNNKRDNVTLFTDPSMIENNNQ